MSSDERSEGLWLAHRTKVQELRNHQTSTLTAEVSVAIVHVVTTPLSRLLVLRHICSRATLLETVSAICLPRDGFLATIVLSVVVLGRVGAVHGIHALVVQIISFSNDVANVKITEKESEVSLDVIQ